MPLTLSTPVRFVKRIGDRVAANLAERGVHTIEDLLYHLPFRYEDRLHPRPLSQYRPGDMASLLGEVRGTTLLRTRSAPIFEMTVGIAPPRCTLPPNLSSRPERSAVERPAVLAAMTPPQATQSPSPFAQDILETVKCIWFNGTYLKDKFRPGQTIALYGKLEASRSGTLAAARSGGLPPGFSRFKMIQPTFEILPDASATGDDAEFTMLEMGRIVPIYESLGGTTPWGAKLTSRWLRRVLWTIFRDLTESAPSTSPKNPAILSEATRGSSQAAQPKDSPKNPVILSEATCGSSHVAQPKDSPKNPAILSEANCGSSQVAQPKDPPKNPVILSEATCGSSQVAQPKDPPYPPPLHLSPPLSRTNPPTPSPGAPFMATASPSTWVGFHHASPATRSPSPDAQSPPASQSDETLPSALLARLHLPSRMDALRDLHFPPAGTSLPDLQSARTPAHRRLIFEEFFYLELGLELKRRRLHDRPGTAFLTDDSVRQALKQILPFKPTAAQKRVLGEIVHDMRRPQPMRRLLQGDVGSGKTIVAFQAALVAIENGYQVALMAPTEILATQHYLSARKLLADKLSPRARRPYRIGLLTGSLDDRSKRDTRNRISRGDIDLAIGTHALVEDNVDFARLGLVIVDEQHRFGVQQRFQLTRKPTSGTSPIPVILSAPTTALTPVILNNPATALTPVILSERSESKDLHDTPPQHPPETLSTTTTAPATQSLPPSAQDPAQDPDVLVMTATPIPRTLALTLYGDLEASVIDELPPHRTPILTRRISQQRSSEVWGFVRKQVAAGRQAYIVYPIIEGPATDQPELDFATDPTPETTQPAPSAPPSSRPSPPAPPSSRPSPSAPLSSRPKRSAVERPAVRTTKTSTSTTTAPLLNPRNLPKLRSATEMHAQLQSGELKGLRLGLLHGRMSTDDKEVTMARFKRGELDVLVATTVIEVGVDVPNATLMVIDHAERFGLAQLHQLRGRVGRGATKSFCVLLTGPSISPVAELRIDAMVHTQDGFALAELDLQQRGPGEFFGTRQAGLPDLRFASLTRDRDLLELARTEAARFAAAPDPAIPRPEIDAVWSRLKLQWQRRYGLLEA